MKLAINVPKYLLSRLACVILNVVDTQILEARSRCNIRQNNFSQRVINAWNRLPEQVIAATTVNGFKNAIDRHFREIHGVSMNRSLNP